MAGNDDRSLPREEFLPLWTSLRERVIAYLEETGKRFGPFTATDFWVVDDDFNLCLIQVEILDLDLLQPAVTLRPSGVARRFSGICHHRVGRAARWREVAAHGAVAASRRDRGWVEARVSARGVSQPAVRELLAGLTPAA